MKKLFPFLTMIAILCIASLSVTAQNANRDQRPVQYKGTAFGDPARYGVDAPIRGCTISIKLEPGGQLIANVQTNEKGEFVFKLPNGIVIPANAKFSMAITTSKNEKDNIMVPINAKEGTNFTYSLTWFVVKASNTGGFAVSGRSSN
ncbi:MAG: hypothetical protein NTY07_18935 [Bacteroidia bacterium]|nr:hypothetical protein [Bacteroidia bacterium]